MPTDLMPTDPMPEWSNADLYRLYECLQRRFDSVFLRHGTDIPQLYDAKERVMTLIRERGNS